MGNEGLKPTEMPKIDYNNIDEVKFVLGQKKAIREQVVALLNQLTGQIVLLEEIIKTKEEKAESGSEKPRKRK